MNDNKFNRELTRFQDQQEAEYERELDREQELAEKLEELQEKFSNIIAELLKQQVTEISDFPRDPDEFVEDVKDMIVDMWPDYCDE